MSNQIKRTTKIKVLKRDYKPFVNFADLEIKNTTTEEMNNRDFFNSGICAYFSFDKFPHNAETPKYPLTWKELIPFNQQNAPYVNRQVYRLSDVCENVNLATKSDTTFYSEISLNKFHERITENKTQFLEENNNVSAKIFEKTNSDIVDNKTSDKRNTLLVRA
ncbi:MAG: hypothetical protein ACRC4L_00575 [Mycoplasma sp.]